LEVEVVVCVSRAVAVAEEGARRQRAAVAVLCVEAGVVLCEPLGVEVVPCGFLAEGAVVRGAEAVRRTTGPRARARARRWPDRL